MRNSGVTNLSVWEVLGAGAILLFLADISPADMIVAERTATSPPAFTSMVIFGDSLSDTGNIRLPDWLLGRERSDGRFTSGPDTTPPGVAFGVWHEGLAGRLQLSPAGPSDLGGTNYAHGDALTGLGTRNLGITDNVGEQVSDYLVSAGTSNGGVLHGIWAGGNDLIDAADAVDSNPATRDSVSLLALEVPARTAAANLKGYVVSLVVNTEAQYLIWPNLPALDRIPHVQEGGSLGLPYTDATKAALAYAVSVFNDEWNAAIADICATYPDVIIYGLDVHGAFACMLDDPARYGYANVVDQACVEDSLPNADVYLFWDGMHPTASAHQLLGAAAYNMILGIPDADFDGAVDMADYAIWFNHYGAGGLWSDGDFDGNSVVDMADYAAWFNNYGYAGTGAVPEPATLSLLALGGLAMLRRRK